MKFTLFIIAVLAISCTVVNSTPQEPGYGYKLTTKIASQDDAVIVEDAVLPVDEAQVVSKAAPAKKVAPKVAPAKKVAPKAPVHQAPKAPAHQAPKAPAHQAPKAPAHQAPKAPAHQAPKAPAHSAPTKSTVPMKGAPAHSSPVKVEHHEPLPPIQPDWFKMECTHVTLYKSVMPSDIKCAVVRQICEGDFANFYSLYYCYFGQSMTCL